MFNVRWILLRNRINIRNSLNVVGVYFYFSFFFFLIEHFYLPYMRINWFYFEKLLSGMSGSKRTLWTGIWRLFLESKWRYSSFTKPGPLHIIQVRGEKRPATVFDVVYSHDVIAQNWQPMGSNGNSETPHAYLEENVVCISDDKAQVINILYVSILTIL